VLALDQILNTASKMLAMSGRAGRLPDRFSGTKRFGRPIGARSTLPHSRSYYANIPGIKVVSPSNGYDAKGLLKQAIRFEEDPVIFMEGRKPPMGINQRCPMKNIISNWARPI